MNDTRRKRVTAFSVYAAAFLAYWLFIGLPTDIITLILWLWIASICWHIDKPRRYHLGFLRDWLPLGAALVLYDISRGKADNNRQPHLDELIAADKWMFGGEIPTVWLQRHFYDPGVVHWWDALASCVYFSHFVAAPVIAGVLWLRSRDVWLKFIRRWLALIVLGLATYFIYPAAPPWWAARDGLIPEIARISTRGWKAFGLHGAGNLLSKAQELSNPIAAMPSLHSAFALFVAAFLFLRVRARWRPLLALYPLAMVLTLVYSGEHWVIDAVVGYAYVAIVFAVVNAAEKGWAAWARRASPATAPTPEDTKEGTPINAFRGKGDPY